MVENERFKRLFLQTGNTFNLLDLLFESIANDLHQCDLTINVEKEVE